MSPRRVALPTAPPVLPVAADPSAPITIVGVEARNFHRLEVAEVRHVPGKGLVRITGKNRQGKTSLLSAIAATLGGASMVRTEPVRTTAVLRPDMLEPGEQPEAPLEEPGTLTRLLLSNGFRLTRTYTEANPKGYLAVQGPDGGKHGQSKLDGWLGELAFDPLAFYSLKGDRQRDVLLSLGQDPELPQNLAEVRGRRAQLYAERTPWISQQRGAARIPKPDGERPVLEDVQQLLARIGELQVAERRRGDLLREYERAQQGQRLMVREANARLERDVEQTRLAYAGARAELQSAEEEVGRLQRELEAARSALALAGQRLVETEAEVERAQEALDLDAHDPEVAASSVPMPELPEDPAEEMEAVKARISQLEQARAALAPWERYEEAQRMVAEAAAKVAELGAAMEDTEAQEAHMLAAAGISIPGLSFSAEGLPLLNGHSLEVASGAERIRLAVEVALAAKPQLRIVLVDEANDLDLDSLAELDTLARDKGLQVWVARIGLEGAGEVVVADGVARDNAAPYPLQPGELELSGSGG